MQSSQPIHFNLVAAAHAAMIEHGFQPDFPAAAAAELAAIETNPEPTVATDTQDLRSLLWSSIDNDTSRDLDQIEWTEQLPDGRIRVLIGVADVDARVVLGTVLDSHARSETTSVYTGVRVFPMLPAELSEGITSLNESEDRAALVIEYTVDNSGTVADGKAYRALVRNRAQLAYNGVGAWLEAAGDVPSKVAASPLLAAQLKLQDAAAQRMLGSRFQHGALDLETIETRPVMLAGEAVEIARQHKNRATSLIEEFMVAANGVIAKIFDEARVASILLTQKQKDPDHFPDLSLAVVKLMGPGEYVLVKPDEVSPGHFGLAVQDYTHSTAPNRRFPDVVTQRLLKAWLAKAAQPYSEGDLNAIAQRCTLMEDNARKVEREMQKRIAAVVLHPHIGQSYRAIVTGVNQYGVFVRTLDPHVDGMVVSGGKGLDVGDRVTVRLVSTDPQRGFIDFAV